ncbi:hypothetical protein Daesc_000797 [Daldinia eschscholtzii]|uniref:Ring-like domain-containing protein n=1 Tax=Daldinia eschscholtzii TaxID=292717 RepID=A0AAX6MZT0_9PEZI
MLEFFTYKKVKKHREDKAEKQKLEKEKENDKGKGKEENPKSDAAKASTDVAHHSESTSSPEITLQRADGMPILDPEDEKFLERLTSPSDSAVSNGGGGGDDEIPPPLPPRVKTPVIELEDSDASSLASKEENNKQQQEVPTKDGEGKGKGKDKEKHKGKDKDKHDGDHKPKRFSFVTNLSRNMSLKRKPTQHLSVPATSSSPTPSEQELRKEETEIARVLEDLNLAASTDANNNNKTFSLSRESAETLRKFTQVLKDLVNGVPTAYNDLVALIEDRDGVLARSYDKLPSSLKKLVAQLPEKLTSSLAPELLAAAAEAQGLKGTSAEGGGEGGDKLSKGDAVKKLLGANNLLELVTKPGAVVGLLKGIVNALKARWPAFVGTNALWSVAVFLLLSALWYCYKRGRETRLEKEASDAEAAEAERRGKEEELVEGGKEGGGGEVLRIEGGSSDGQQQQQQQQPTVSVSAPAA